MSYVDYEAIAITATSSGSVATESTKLFTGLVHMVRYVANGSTSGVIGDDDSSFAITAEKGGQTILSIAVPSTSATWYPRAAVIDTAGTASTGYEPVPLNNERVVITVSSGSTDQTTKTGEVRVYVS